MFDNRDGVMIGRLFINDKDAWATWGVTLRKGSYDALDLGAPQKESAKNSSSSQHGAQFFGNKAKVDERQVTLLFYIDASTKRELHDRKVAFEEELRSGLSLFRIPEQFTIYKLRLNDFTAFKSFNQRTKAYISARFTEPNPKDRIAL